MKKADIVVGGKYSAKVSGRIVTVRVDAIRERPATATFRGRTVFDVTNLDTGRKLTFDSAAKFRGEVKEKVEDKKGADPTTVRTVSVERLSDTPSPPAPKSAGGSTTVSVTTSKPKFEGGSVMTAKQPIVVGDTVRVSKEAGVKVETDIVKAIDGNLITLASGPRVHRDWVTFESKGDEPCPSDTPKLFGSPTMSKPPEPKTGATATTASPGVAVGRPTAPSSPSATTVAGTAVTASPGGTALPVRPAVTGNGSAGSTATETGLPDLSAIVNSGGKAYPKRTDLPPHVIVKARAGSGKTWTLTEGLKLAYRMATPGLKPSPQQRAVWESLELTGVPRFSAMCAFNTSIAAELSRRLPQVKGCQARTLHGLGNYAVRKAFNLTKEPNDHRVDEIIAELKGESDLKKLRKESPILVKATKELVGLCKQNLVGHPVCDNWDEALDKLVRYYDVEIGGTDELRDQIFELVPRVLERCKDVARDGYIDFNDMIWLPVVLRLSVFQNDVLLVDEAQDLNRCQQAFAKMAGKRLILCGDPTQAIYGFAGADAESMRRLEVELSATERGCVLLPLTVTRRCGKAIVREAQRYVPDLEAHESNPEGEVLRAKFTVQRRRTPSGQYEFFEPPVAETYLPMVQDGDMILCRANAPLVKELFRFLKMGRKAYIQGKKVGEALIALLDKLEATMVPELITKLDDWCATEIAKEQAQRNPSESRIELIQDKHDCLMAFTTEAVSVEGVKAKLMAVFTDDPKVQGIRLSSIHKAKGLEAHRVFYIQGFGRPDDKLSPWEVEQEQNLRYVAITRAINTLVYVQ